jgi:hypothetical protein
VLYKEEKMNKQKSIRLVITTALLGLLVSSFGIAQVLEKPPLVIDDPMAPCEIIMLIDGDYIKNYDPAKKIWMWCEELGGYLPFCVPLELFDQYGVLVSRVLGPFD